MPIGELTLPSWLGPGEPAGAPLLRGAQAGSLIRSSFLAARQQKMRESQMQLEEEEKRALIQGHYLQRRATEQNMQMGALNIAAQMRKNDAAVNVTKGNVELARKMSTIDWTSPSDRASVWEIGKQYPELLETPEWNRIQQNFINSDRAAVEAEKYKTQLELLQERNKLLEDKSAAGTPTQQDIAAAQKLRAQAEALRSSGDPTGYQDKIRQAELLETHVAPKGITIQTGVDERGNAVNTVSIGGAGAPTTGTQTMAQQKQISFETATEGINDIVQRLRPADVGVAGVVGENVFDRWLGQLDPKLVSGERVSNRRALGALRETLFQALSPERIGGSGFSNKDAERIKEIADSLEAKHSYPEVKQSLNTIRDIIADRSRVFAERTGQPVPDFAKTPEMIQNEYVTRLNALKKSVDNFTLTREQADAESKALAQRTADALKRFHGIDVNFK